MNCLEKLIDAQKKYIKVLEDELCDVIPIANIHGWRSVNIEKEHFAREEIKEAEKSATLLQPTGE